MTRNGQSGPSTTDREKEKWMASAEVQELLRGNKPRDADELLPHTGLVHDERTRWLVSHFAKHYDPTAVDRPMPAQFEDTRLYQLLVSPAATETATKAIHHGDTQTQSFLVGDPGAKSDVSGIKAIEKLMNIIGRPATILYIFGPPGAGKTNFGLLAAQLWKREHPDGVLGSNIRTWKECDEWLRNYGDLDEWLSGNLRQMSEGGVTQVDDADPMLFVFDEASSHASGRGEKGHEAGKKLGPLVYKIRKSNAGLVIIGHDGRDVHPAVRTLATVVEKKRDEQKRATVFEDVRDRQGRGEIVSLTGIPVTDYSYDDKEATSWSWGGAEDDEEATLAQAREMAEDMREEQIRELAAYLASAEWLDLNQTEIGRALGEAYRGEPYRRTWVSKWKSRYAQEGESDA